MPVLAFRVQAEWEKVVRLREEIKKLKAEAKTSGSTADFGEINKKLESCTAELKTLIDKATEAGVAFEQASKNILTASQAIIDAQDRILQSAQQSQSVQAEAAKQSTVSLQQQARAYEQVKDGIEQVMGTANQNAKSIQQTSQALKIVEDDIRRLNKQIGDRTPSQQQMQMLTKLTIERQKLRNEIAENSRNLNTEVKILQAASGSMDEMSQKLGQMRTAYRAMSEEQRNSDFGKQLLAAIQQTDAKLKELDATIGNHQRNVGNYDSSLQGLIQQAQGIPGPIGQAASAVNGLTKASLRFIATPLGMVLAAISGALALVTSWFNRTEEGQNALSVSTAYFKQVLESVLDVADNVGEWLYKAFTKPKEAISDLWHTLKDKLLADMKRFVDMAAGVVDIFSGNVSEGVGKVAAAWSGIGTGGWKADVRNKANERVKIAERQNELDRQERENLVERAKMEAKIAALREKAYDTSVSKQEQLKASKEAENLTKKMYEDEIALARKRYEIIRDTNALSHSNKEAKRQEAEAEARVYQLESQRNTAMRSLLRQSSRLSNQQSTAAKKAQREAEKQAAAEEKMEQLKSKQAVAAERNAKDIEFSTREAEIKAMKDGTDKKLKQIELDRDREMEAIFRAYEDIRIKRIEEAKRVWDADPKNKGKNFYDSEAYKFSASEDRYTAGEKANKAEREKAVQAEYVNNIDKLTSDFQSAIDKRAEKYRQYTADIAAMESLRTKAEAEGNEEAVEGLNERIKLAKLLRSISEVDAGEESYKLKYGTWSEKLSATNSKYQRQIDEANARKDTGLAKSLQKEWEEAVASLNIEKLKEQINWDVVFGNLSGVSKQRLAEVKKQMDTFLKSPQFKKMSPQNQKVLSDALKQIQVELNDRGGIFQGLIDATSEYRTALDELRIATEEYDEAVKQYGEDSKEAQEKLKIKNQKERNAQNAGSNVKDSLDTTVEKVRSISNMAKAMSQAGDDAVGAMASVFGSLSQILGSAGGWASIVALVLDLLDMIGDQGLDGFLANVLDGVSHAVGGILDTIGSLFGASGLGGIFKGADTKQYDAMVAEYSSLIDIWDKLLDAKTKYINMSYGPEAVKAGNEAQSIVQKEIDAWRNLGRERLNAGASAGSHSYGVRSRKNMSYEDWVAVAKSLGRSTNDWAGLGGRLTGLFDLSVEQLEKLRNDAPEFWAKLDGEAQDYLNKIIEGAEKLEDIQEKVRQQMTSTTFDALKNQFADALYDMEGTAKERGQKIKEALFKSIIDNFVLGSDFDDWLEGFYKKWADRIGTGTMSSYDWDAYSREYNDMLEQKIAERDRWAAAMGYTGSSTESEQSATANAIQNITQDQANALEGRITATQIAVEQGNTKKDAMLDSLTLTQMTLSDIRSVQTDHRDIADDTRDILANSYLELREINEHQDKIEKAVTSMQSDVQEMKNDIKDLR